jgi:Zn-finger nucleic acid-binding protein
MDTHPYHAGGNAVIDTCHRCKLIWLDAGEASVLGKYPDRTGIPAFATVTEKEDEQDPGALAPTFSLLDFLIRLR